jgi:hypothetical protein
VHYKDAGAAGQVAPKTPFGGGPAEMALFWAGKAAGWPDFSGLQIPGPGQDVLPGPNLETSPAGRKALGCFTINDLSHAGA